MERLLRGFAYEKGKPSVVIEVADLERRFCASLARPSAWRVNRGEVGGAETKVDLGWCGATEALVRP